MSEVIGSCRAELNRTRTQQYVGFARIGGLVENRRSFAAGVGAGPAPGRSVTRTGKLPAGPGATLLELAENRGPGGPVESLTGRASPGQHGLGEPEYRGLFGTLRSCGCRAEDRASVWVMGR